MPVVTGKYGPLVGAIDEGTSSARFLESNKFQIFLRRDSMVTTITSSHHQRNLIVLIDSQYLSSFLASKCTN
jgi:hypothetical protein